MATPHPGSRWTKLDADVSQDAYDALTRCDLPVMMRPIEHRPLSDEPMDDVILLFGALVRRRTALVVAMELEDPELANSVLADRVRFDCDADPRGRVFDLWEKVLPPEVSIEALAVHDSTESNDDMMEADDGLDLAA